MLLIIGVKLLGRDALLLQLRQRIPEGMFPPDGAADLAVPGLCTAAQHNAGHNGLQNSRNPNR